MTCKDCFHYQVCGSFGFVLDPLHGGVTCCDFKTKADVVEVKHGEWIKREVSLSHKNETLAQCSVCGENGLVESAFPFESCVRRLKYCPYCGAKMDLKEGVNYG
jgi:hypothetical protein